MVSLCSFDALISTRVQGFWSPLLTVPFGRLSLHPSLFLPSSPQLPPSPLKLFSITMSSSATPMIPAASPASVFPQTVLENSYNHLRDRSPNGGYMNYGVQVSETEPTYFPVRCAVLDAAQAQKGHFSLFSTHFYRFLTCFYRFSTRSMIASRAA